MVYVISLGYGNFYFVTKVKGNQITTAISEREDIGDDFSRFTHYRCLPKSFFFFFSPFSQRVTGWIKNRRRDYSLKSI